MLHHAKITVTASGQGSIVVDDHDLSNGCRGFSVDARVGNMTELRLELLSEETVIDGEVRIRFDSRSAQLLEQLGWTPPAEQP